MADDIKLFLIHFAVSGVAAAISKTLVSPLERTKLILQNQEASHQILKSDVPKYNGIIDCLIRLPQEQGIFSYWRGNGANIMRYIPLQALNFSFYSMYYDIFESYCCADYAKTFGSGALAGLSSITVVFPLDFCTTRLAVDIGTTHGTNSPKREFHGLRHCLSAVAKTDGILGLYKGYTASAIGLTIYRSVYFGLYESYKEKYSRTYFQEAKWEESSFVAIQIMVAQIVTTIAAWVSYPFDTAGRRMMLEASKPQKYRQIKNMKHSFYVIYMNEGIFGFYKGALANIMRSTGGALVLVLYDEILYHSPFQDIAKNKKFQKMQKNLVSCK